MLIALCLGFFMVIIDVTIVTVALPTIAKDLGGNIAWLQWVVDGYTLTFACLLLSAGSIGDRFGAKSTYLSGLILFILTSLACGMATSFLVLTIFRLLQGVAGAMLVPTSLALINSSYKEKPARSRAIGIWGSIAGVAAAIGPVVGALLTAWVGWRAVFLINLPIGILGIILTLKYVIPAQHAESNDGEFDFAGQVFAIISIAALAFGLIEAGRFGWISTIVMSSLGVFLITFFIFLIIENNTVAPMFPLKFFKSAIFSTAIAVGMIINTGFYGILFLLPLYFQNIHEYSIIMTGLAIAPLSALTVFGSYLAGRLVSISGPKIIMVCGLAISALGFCLLSFVIESTSYLVILLPLLLIGAGGSLTMPSATIAVINSVGEGRAGIASGAFNASRQIGSLIGVAVYGTLVNTAINFVGGMRDALIITVILSILACVLTLWWIDSEFTNKF